MCEYERIAKDDWLTDFREICTERHFKWLQYSLNEKIEMHSDFQCEMFSIILMPFLCMCVCVSFRQ